MKMVFSHVWAIWWWRHTHVQATADSLRTNRCALSIAPSLAKELAQVGARAVWEEHTNRGIPRSIPMELLSKDAISRSSRTNVCVRRWNGPIPLGSICKAGDHFTASPEFCFVLVAGSIRRICAEGLSRWQHVVVLAELGCELCGTYSKQDTRRGFKGRRTPLVSTCQMRDCGRLTA